MFHLWATPAPSQTLVGAALPPFVRVERTLQLGLRWRVRTVVVRESATEAPVVLDIPLLPGESVTTAGIRVADGRAQVQLAPGTAATWDAVLDEGPVLAGSTPLRLRAAETTAWAEVWRLEVAPVWHVTLSGIPPTQQFGSDGVRRPTWRPWPGEEVTVAVSRPEGLPGQALTVDASRLDLAPGPRATAARLALTLRSSMAGEHALHLPPGAELEAVTRDGIPLAIRPEGTTLLLPLERGAHTFDLAWRDPAGMASWLETPAIDVGAPGVNADVTVTLPDDRWVLAVGGPALGPAVQTWAVLGAVALLALGLGRLRATPLRWWHWVVLGLGLVGAPLWAGPTVVAWLLVLGWRARRPDLDPVAFDLRQVLVVLLTAATAVALGAGIVAGLVGHPDMGIAGNDSSAQLLRWTADRTGAALPRAWVLSLPAWVHRVLVLAWTLWMAWSLRAWLRWGYRTLGADGFWRGLHRPAAAPPVPGAEAE